MTDNKTQIEPVIEGTEVTYVDKDVYLFFLLSGKPSSQSTKVATPGKLKTGHNYVATCEALRLKAVSPSIEEAFKALELDIRGAVCGRTPKDTTEYLLNNGYGLGFPAESHDPKKAALQTVLNCDPDFLYKMVNVRLTVRVHEQVTPQTAREISDDTK